MRLIIFFLSIFLISCQQETQTPTAKVVQPVKTEVLTSSSDTQQFDRIPGKVMASQRAELKFQVPGKLMKFSVKESQEVKKGDLLAKLDPRDYKTKLTKVNSQISQARAQLKAMKAGARPEDVKVLKAELSAAKAKFRESERQFQRYKDLWAKRIISKSNYDKQESAYSVAKAQLNTAKQTLNKGKTGARKEDVEAMQSSIKGLLAQREEAQNALDDTKLKAPFSGVVAKTFVKNFQNINPTDPILSLQDISKLEVVINVPERVIISSKGSEFYQFVAEFEAAKNRLFPLELKEYKTEADQKTQTYRAVFTMQAPKDLKILPGMTATVIVTEQTNDEDIPIKSFFAPASAIFSDEFNKQYVWIVQPDMILHRREVVVGELTQGNIQLLEGINGGERIVTAGVHFLQEGMKVKLFDSQARY